MFMLGERLNEWRQGRGRFVPKEFLIEPLSDPEIYRLLDCLAKHNELNTLEKLNREMQFAVIKEKHRKELLVALREATEGRSFDAILEDEYRGINDSSARKMYLIVCFFYQHGSYVRDILLAQLLNMNLVEVAKLDDYTMGVIHYDCINESQGIYGARARHRIIASVVWERCADLSEKEALIQNSLNSLNLGYLPDRKAFDEFIKSDRIVDSIRTLDGKVKYFEKACTKDPINPYIRQHYARMLSREDKDELALSQIDEAIKLNKNVRIFHHTKGVILKKLAIKLESVELARRRLAQSEECFRKAISMYKRDDYSFKDLADLYLEWARRAESSDEQLEYIEKAEITISEGLKHVYSRDSLWIVSSEIQKFIGNEPSRIRALEKAISETPSSIVGRYLLGRTYRKGNMSQKALEVLKPIIEKHHEEFRAFVEYAISMLNIGRPYAEAIAVLRLSNLYGLSDPRYIATLGGMLFLNKEFPDAESVFNETNKHHFTADELNKIQFCSPDPSDSERPLVFEGTVISLKAGYAWIHSEGYPSFFCPSSKYGGVNIQLNLRVKFKPCFSARGPLAIVLEVA